MASSPSQQPDPAEDGLGLGTIAGPVLLATCLNWALYGALCVQTYFYYLGFPNDRMAIKCLVGFWIAVDTAQTIMVMHDTFYTYGTHFGDPRGLDLMQLNWLSVPVVTGIMSFSVQLFFAYRLWVLSKSKIVVFGIGLVALTQASAAIVSGVQGDIGRKFSGLYKAYVSTALWLTGSAVCDVLIAGLMSYHLYKTKTKFRTTKVLVRKLIRLTIESGVLTAIIAVVDDILFLAEVTKPYHFVPAAVLGKLYTNSALAMLNSRMNIAGGRDSTLGHIVEENTWATSSATRSATRRPVNIKISRTVETDVIPMETPRVDKGKMGSGDLQTD